MRRALVCVLAATVAACSSDAVSPKQQVIRTSVVTRDSLAPLYGMNAPNRIPGEYMVRFANDVGDADALTNDLISTYGGKALAIWKGMKGFWGQLPPQAVDALRRNPHVRMIEANYWAPTATTYQDVSATVQGNWGLDRIDQRGLPLDTLYGYDYNGSGVHLWIVDDGVDPSLPELAGRVDTNYYATFNGTDPFAPCRQHGNITASIAAGTVHGVAKAATIHVSRISDECTGTHVNMGAASSAVNFIADYSPRPAVANLSITVDCKLIFCGTTPDDAIRYAVSRGVTVVVSAGNGGDDLIGDDACGFAPAHVAEAITVAASDLNDGRPTFSNYGSCVDLFAPGSGLMWRDNYTAESGTSVAAPLVARVAALYLQQVPSASPGSVTTAILRAATTGVITNPGSSSPNRLLYSNVPLQQTVTINGPSIVNGGPGYCYYTASVIDGAPPFTYQWSGVITGTGTQVSGQIHASGQLAVEVWDSQGRYAFSQMYVTVAQNGDTCDL
ncbi:MAG TPA: S8 family peptidase [Longimicrobiales bacterium]|nr:S8 family peptidase [Longimicrobiales bacterium]